MSTAVAQADGVLDRAYRRFGWRLVLGLPIAVWGSGLATWGFIVVPIVRLLELTASEVRVYVAASILLLFVCTALSVSVGIYACAPLRRYERGESTAEETWRAAVRIPSSALKPNYMIAALVALPGGLVILALVDGLSTEVAGIFMLCAVGVSLYNLAAEIFLTPIFFRPVLRGIARSFEGHPPPASGILLSNRLLFVVPGLGVAMAVAGCAIGFTPGQDTGAALTHMIVATLSSAAAVIPITFLLGKSVNDPIVDLLEGTKRVRDADYATPVPELSSDELGELARSFNEAMVGLADRQRLSHENVGLLDEVRASRARIVAASDASRRRVERNLHDGAQQRLVALALDLRLLEESASSTPIEDVVAAIRRATGDVKGSLAELRELARGLHPTVLTTDGLSPALRQLGARSKVPVTVSVPERRFPQEIETAAYFFVAESLSNIAKYAQASHATVSVCDDGGRLVVSIADDGVGGASLGSGTGLAGLADRVAALDGVLTIDSPAGRGTTVVAELPADGAQGVDRTQFESKVG